MKKEIKATSVTIEVTNYCNLNCIMCFKKGLPKQVPKHMSLELFKKILDDIKPIKGVCFVGLGEPLLNPAFPYMLLEARKRGLSTNMATNGFLIDDIIARGLVKLVGKISISLDSATKENYEKIRKGSNFNKIIENIKILVKEKKKQDSIFPFIRLDMVGMKCNIHELVDLVRLAKKIGINSINMLHIQPLTKELEKQHLCNMPKEEVQAFFKEALFEAWKLGIVLKIRPLEPICEFCDNMWKNPYIDSDGNISICCLTGSAKDKSIEYFKDAPVEVDPSKITFGNLYKQSFKEIWNSDKIINFREKYNRIFTLDMRKKWDMKSYLKLRKENKFPDTYCLVCARRFTLVC